MKTDQNGDILIRDYRCCMCPAGDGQVADECKGKCNFILRFRDSRGWIYFVRTGIGGKQFKAFYKKDPSKPDGVGEHGYRSLPWQVTFDRAQEDLNKLAQVKGWISI